MVRILASVTANNSSNTYCILKKRQSWFWFVLIGLPCISAECLGVNTTVATYPSGTINIRYGDPLEIYCVAESYTSDDLEFTSKGEFVESQKINDTTRRLYIENPEKQISAYYCRNKRTRKMCVNRVLVESPPAIVTDFNCISINLNSLKCVWTSPAVYTHVNYTLVQTLQGNRLLPACRVQSTYFSEDEKRNVYNYCIWNLTSLPRYRNQEDYLNFDLTGCNIIGCSYQNFSIDHYSIVQPDPPMSLEMDKIEPHSVKLSWRIPLNMVDLLPCGVEHIIEYQTVNIDSPEHFHQVDASTLRSKNETYRFKLSNLPYAHMQYRVRIYIKSRKAVKPEYLSAFSFVDFYTASERPRRPPDMIAGAFEQATFNENRIVNVYWKQLEEYEEAGANFTYKVLITQGNNTFPIVYPDKNTSLSYITQVVSNEALNVKVWSVNAEGSSIHSSYLYIPAKEDVESLGVTSFTKISHENGTYELYWVGVDNIDNYSLFWCKYNISNVCSGRMDFDVLDPMKNSYIINLPTDYKYQFAISANKVMKTSGMVWAKCDISKYALVMYKVPVDLFYGVPGKSYVHLTWRLDCNLPGSVITGYNISYCPIVEAKNYCSKSNENLYKLISDPKQMDVLIENLRPLTTYKFALTINTVYGPKQFKEATTVVTTMKN